MIDAYARALQAWNRLTYPDIESARHVWTEMGTVGATGTMGVFIYAGHPSLRDHFLGYPISLGSVDI